MGRPFPSKLPLPMGDLDPILYIWFLGPIRVLNSNRTSIVQPFLQGSLTVTDRPTDHATRSVTTGHICVGLRAMPPNNISAERILGYGCCWQAYPYSLCKCIFTSISCYSHVSLCCICVFRPTFFLPITLVVQVDQSASRVSALCILTFELNDRQLQGK